MSHLYFSYTGNKRKEYKYIKDKFNFDGIKNIIEPFCGSAAISFNIWLEYGDKFNYYINDNDIKLIEIYKLFEITAADIIYEKLTNIHKNITNKEQFVELHINKNKNIYEYLTILKLSGIRLGWYNGKRVNNVFKYYSPLQLKFLEFLKSDYVYISNNDWYEIFDKYKNDATTIFIFDPPYINRDNTLYRKPSLNVYNYFKNNNINTFNSKIYFMLEDIPEIRELFETNTIYEPYEKKYCMKSIRNNTKHIIISN